MKKIVTLGISFLFIFLTSCSADEHTTAFTPEFYYLPEEAMQAANVSKQTTVLYLAADESQIETVDELKEQVGEQVLYNVRECDFSAQTCEESTLYEDGEKIGAITYSYRYDTDKKYVISKISEDTFREFVFVDGRLEAIKDYASGEITADSVPVTTRAFQYDNSNKCVSNLVDTVDGEGNPIQYRYGFDYTEEGQLSRIYVIGYDGDGEDVVIGRTELVYNEANLIQSSTYYAVVGDERRIVSHYEYIYE